MRSIDIALKDLLQIARDWKSALFLLVMPVLFTIFFGLIFGPVFARGEEDPRLPVAVFQTDAADPLGDNLVALMATSEVIRPVTLDADGAIGAAEQVTAGDFAALVTIPAGYGEELLAGETPPLAVVADRSAAAGRTALTALEMASGRLLGAVETAEISAETYAENQRVALAGEARRAYLLEAVSAAIARWSEPPLTVAVERATGTAMVESDSRTSNGFVQSSPGMIVQFAIFGLITSAMVLVLERKSRALQRLLTAPIIRPAIIGGHILAMFLVVFLQQLLLVALGQLAFGVDYLREPLAVLALMITLSFWAASLGLLISAVAKDEDQVIVLSLVAMFLFAALGGAWFPLEVAGRTFAAIGHVMPTAWAMDGFQNIVLRGLGPSSVLLPAGALALYAVVFFALAVWRFRYE